MNPLLCRSQDSPLAGLLDESNDPQIGWIGLGVEFDVNVLGETISGLDAADFCRDSAPRPRGSGGGRRFRRASTCDSA